MLTCRQVFDGSNICGTHLGAFGAVVRSPPKIWEVHRKTNLPADTRTRRVPPHDEAECKHQPRTDVILPAHHCLQLAASELVVVRHSSIYFRAEGPLWVEIMKQREASRVNPSVRCP